MGFCMTDKCLAELKRDTDDSSWEDQDTKQVLVIVLWCHVACTYMCRRCWGLESPGSPDYDPQPGVVVNEIRPNGDKLRKRKPIPTSDPGSQTPVREVCTECVILPGKAESEGPVTKLIGRWLCPAHYHKAMKDQAKNHYGREMKFSTFPVMTISGTIVQTTVHQPIGS